MRKIRAAAIREEKPLHDAKDVVLKADAEQAAQSVGSETDILLGLLQLWRAEI